jgi:hypothetical protein
MTTQMLDDIGIRMTQAWRSQKRVEVPAETSKQCLSTDEEREQLNDCRRTCRAALA